MLNYNKDEQKDIPITMCQDQLEEAYQLGIDISNIEKEKNWNKNGEVKRMKKKNKSLLD